VELRQLRYLIGVIQHGGFRSAARELGVAQPTLTAQVRQLELEVGALLVDRTSRPIRATAAGSVVVARGHELLAIVAELESEISTIAGQQTGRLRLGTNHWAMPIVPSLVAAFTSRYPNIDVLLRGVSMEAPRLMLRGELDVCLLALRTGEEHMPRQLQSRKLFSFEHVFAVPQGHRLADRELVNLEDLAGERLVLSSGSSGASLKQALSQAGMSPHVVVETNELDMVTLMVSQGMGIGFTPEFLVRRSHPELKIFRVSQVSIKSDAFLSWAGRLPDAPALKAFVEFVISQHWTAD
jgi:DNA-binding transcriptional LysR family regulator